MKDLSDKRRIELLQIKITRLEERVDELVGFLTDAIQLRVQLDAGDRDPDIERLLP